MADDPVDWLEAPIVVGVHLREAAWDLRTKQTGEAWSRDAEVWRVTLRDGIAARSPRDAHKIDAANKFPPTDLPPWHVWYEPEAVGMAFTSTGPGRPGNNPMSRHAAFVERAEEIVREWRSALPAQPKLAKVSVKHTDFEKWYVDRAAADAKTGRRSSRKEDRDAAISHFGCSILWAWITEAHNKLPKDHPYRTPGRRPTK